VTKNNSLSLYIQYSSLGSIRSILIILIGLVHPSIKMFNKNSCRICGSCLTPSVICKIFNEFVSWICFKCNKIVEAKHSDYYCTVLMIRRLELGLQDSDGFEMIINR
jgi:hypothetical protein